MPEVKKYAVTLIAVTSKEKATKRSVAETITGQLNAEKIFLESLLIEEVRD